jgi:hypothetical protein
LDFFPTGIPNNDIFIGNLGDRKVMSEKSSIWKNRYNERKNSQESL